MYSVHAAAGLPGLSAHVRSTQSTPLSARTTHQRTSEQCSKQFIPTATIHLKCDNFAYKFLLNIFQTAATDLELLILRTVSSDNNRMRGAIMDHKQQHLTK